MSGCDLDVCLGQGVQWDWCDVAVSAPTLSPHQSAHSDLLCHLLARATTTDVRQQCAKTRTYAHLFIFIIGTVNLLNPYVALH